eukprot:3736934-Ditylum_brightwellii.AAC.1
MEQLLKLPGLIKNTESISSSMSPIGNATHTSLMPHPLNAASSSLLLLQGCGQASTVQELKSPFHQLRKHLRPSPRPANWMDNKVLSTKRAQLTLTSSQYKGASRG